MGVAWIYGIRNFMQDLSHMELWLPKAAKYFLAVMWTFVIPAALVYLYVDSCIDLTPVRYGMYEYPDWVQLAGLILILMPPIIQAIYAAWFIGWAVADGWTWREFMVKAFKPTDTWWRLREEKFAVQLVGEQSDSSSSDDSEAESDVKE